MNKFIAVLQLIFSCSLIFTSTNAQGLTSADLGRSICDYTRTTSPPVPPGCIATKNDIEQCKQNIGCYCFIVGTYYDLAAVKRDLGMSPKKTQRDILKFVHKGKQDYVSDKFITKLVKQVYSDPEFSSSGLEGQLSKQVESSCKDNTELFK